MATKWAASNGFDPKVAPPIKVGSAVKLTKPYRLGGPTGFFIVQHLSYSCGEWLADVHVVRSAGNVVAVNRKATRYPAYWFEKAA